MNNSPLRIGIAGLGTVGAGTIKLLNQQASLIGMRCGRDITVTAVSARDKSKNRGVDLSGYNWHDDPVALASDCLLYTSDAADDSLRVDLGGRRIIKKQIESS